MTRSRERAAARGRPGAALLTALLAGILAAAPPGAPLAEATAAPPVGMSADPSSTPPDAATFAGVPAVPLRGARPSWYTPALHRRVLAAPLAVRAPLLAPYPGTVGIRPGSWMVSPSGCTMNFVFRRRGALGIGTAGHCARLRQSVVLLTLAPGGGDVVLVNVGRVVARRNRGVGNDFALVRVRRALRRWVSPTAAVIGGPCGVYRGTSGRIVWHYGHGAGIGAGGTPRAGIALGWRRHAFGWAGAGLYGDSGSPVVTGGLEAAGNLTHLLMFDGRFPGTWISQWAWSGSVLGGTRISRMLQIADRWRLVRSDSC